MSLTDGYSLVDFVNRNSTRFSAGVLDFRAGCWVLVADTETAGTGGELSALEPIADLERYLVRARRDAARFPEDYLRLLETWNTRHGQTTHQ